MKIRLLVVGAALGAAVLQAPRQDSGDLVAMMNQIPGVHAHVSGK